MYKSLFIIQVPLTLYFSADFKSVCTKCTTIPRFRGFSASPTSRFYFLFVLERTDDFTLFNKFKNAVLRLDYETHVMFVSRMAPEIRPVQNLQLSHAKTLTVQLVHAKVNRL